MPRDWIDLVDALGPTLVGLIGIPLLVIQFRSFVEQLKSQADLLKNQAEEVRAMRQQVLAGTLGHLYQQQNNIHLFFITNADLRPYFYEKKEAHAPSPEVDAVSEMLMDFFEHIYLQKSNLPNDVWLGWKQYMKDMYDNSPPLRTFAGDHRRYYGEQMIKELTF